MNYTQCKLRKQHNNYVLFDKLMGEVKEKDTEIYNFVKWE